MGRVPPGHPGPPRRELRGGVGVHPPGAGRAGRRAGRDRRGPQRRRAAGGAPVSRPHALALEAAARLRERLPGLKLSVAGQGWWEPRLRQAVARLGLEDTVELLGFVDDVAKHALLARSWVLAMPSVKEGWGLAVMEAAGHATPAVAFRSAGGVAESVVHGRTGLLAGDPEEFAVQLERVLVDRPLRERLGAAARERAAGFSWQQATAAFAGVLDGAVARASATRRR